jgi:hypothetical protein
MWSQMCTCFRCLPASQEVEKFLAGANSMDDHFRETPLESNLPVLMGLTSIWNISFLGYPARAILPYCQVRAGGKAIHIVSHDMRWGGVRSCATAATAVSVWEMVGLSARGTLPYCQWIRGRGTDTCRGYVCMQQLPVVV